VFELEGKEKVKFFGIVADHDDVVELDAELSIDGEIVGHVTTPAYSRRLGKSLALVHLVPSAAVEGTRLDLKGPPFNVALPPPAFPSSTQSASDCTRCSSRESRDDSPFYGAW
jgi:glycine cleavage system aminomethyltransferase T